MRYHYQKPDIYLSMYGELYICNHPVYDRCTLFTIGDKGLAVIQQRFSADTKSTYWAEVDSWLTDSLYSRNISTAGLESVRTDYIQPSL